MRVRSSMGSSVNRPSPRLVTDSCQLSVGQRASLFVRRRASRWTPTRSHPGQSACSEIKSPDSNETRRTPRRSSTPSRFRMDRWRVIFLVSTGAEGALATRATASVERVASCAQSACTTAPVAAAARTWFGVGSVCRSRCIRASPRLRATRRKRARSYRETKTDKRAARLCRWIERRGDTACTWRSVRIVSRFSRMTRNPRASPSRCAVERYKSYKRSDATQRCAR